MGPQASVDEDVVLSKKGDVDDLYKDVPEFDCHCYMKVVSVENAPSAFGGEAWAWKDVSSYYIYWNYDVLGAGAYWVDSFDPDAIKMDFPTSFEELNVIGGTSSGVHDFVMIDVPHTNNIPSDFTIHTKTECYQIAVNGQVLTDPVIYNHTFVWGEGEPGTMQLEIGGLDLDTYTVRRFSRRFQCYDVPEPPPRNNGGSNQ